MFMTALNIFLVATCVVWALGAVFLLLLVALFELRKWLFWLVAAFWLPVFLIGAVFVLALTALDVATGRSGL